MISINPSMAEEGKRIKILQVFKQLTSTDVKELKFILREKLAESVAEKIETPLELLDSLEKLGVLASPDNLESLASLMVKINRQELASKLTGKSYSHNTSGNRAGRDNNRNESIAKGLFFEKVSVLLGPIWHDLGCYSGLPNSIIKKIDEEGTSVQDKALKIFDEMEQSIKPLDWSIIEDILVRLERYQDIRDLQEEIKRLEIIYGEIKIFNTNFVGIRTDVNLDEIEATSIFLHKVASEICSYWTNFGNVAGWSTKEINANNGDVKKKAYKLLCEMRDKSKQPFKWINIREHLKNLNKNNVIKHLEEEITILHERYGPQQFFNADTVPELVD